MATAVLEACKSRKRKPNLFGLHSFASPESTISPFRVNVRLFLQECGEVEEDHRVDGMPTWSTLLISESTGVVFTLYIVEESVQFSPQPLCDHCKCVGWGHHFVSKRRYHMIIPIDENWNKNLKGNDSEIRTHLLHGLIHCNGFGHLLRINGGVKDDSNSSNIRGRDIMDLWDCLCTTLRTRKISVNDYSRKNSMELRLLHGVAFGRSWFGKWGYEFGRGSYGVTEEKYMKSIQSVRRLDLDRVINDFKNTVRGRKIKQIIHSYREASETRLITMGDLLQFMLDFKSRVSVQRKTTTGMGMARNSHSKFSLRKASQCEIQTEEKPIEFSEFVSSLASSDCRWSETRIEYAVQVILNTLKLNKGRVGRNVTMSRQELREEARQCVGDTGLVDYILKSIKAIAVDNTVIVRRLINPSTKLVEFTVQEVSSRSESSTFPSSDIQCDSRWPKHRLENAAQVIVNILKRNPEISRDRNTMPREELRELTRGHIGDTGLIDFVLKSIDNCVVGNQIVCRLRNPSTKLIEFAIRDINSQKIDDHDGCDDTELSPTLALGPGGMNVYEEILFLYRNVVMGYSESNSVSLATRAILDTKYFAKEWPFEDQQNDQLMTLTCRVLPSFDELETELTRRLPPGELVVVPPSITISELKMVAQCALRGTYFVMDRFVVNQIGGLRGIEDERVLTSAVESGAQVWVRGCGLDLDTELRYEGGTHSRTVDCVCGARDDDGEKMVECDLCKVWQHTRCSDIKDDEDEDEDSMFLCGKCRC